ncbi:MAG: tryptophan--tRNA ligase [Firmicutes bacterium]|nr:tryptophan--tRNA ligase [Dethiobacter sp.]MBS3887864.1 tryptophan--tRNA ligase [Bacillota bacterium]MBS4053725.1 tryptophan--tRNA ligase [Thermaerobacter sp.]
MARVFSGIQPSGILTLGNYLGALKHFVERQALHEAFYCIVDLHALTLPQDPAALREQVRTLAAVYLAAGLDPERATLFVQSQVPEHSELAWLLQCLSYLGELSRMTQFKEKGEGRESVSVGLYTYPVLQAADILLYDTELVPVGEDQKQHIELCRDIALRFNQRFGDVFVVPEHQIAKLGARIMSLDDPAKKMSKSSPTPASYISLLDTPETMQKKIMRAVTDTGSEVKYDPEQKPGVSNLLVINALLSERSIASLEELFVGKGYGALKKDTAEVVVAVLDPLRRRILEYLESPDLDMTMRAGAEKARAVASVTLSRVQKAMGLR